MAKTNIKNLGPVLEKIKNAVAELAPSTYLELGEYVKTRILAKARTGRTLASGSDAALKALRPNSPYLDYRKRVGEGKVQGIAVDPEFFSAKRSNLTLTGQYLKSIRPTKVDSKTRTLIVEPDDSSRSDGVSNKDIAKGQAKQGRNIFGMDNVGLKVLKNIVLRAIRAKLSKNLLK